VTLVARDDARLVGDIERLIKKKIDIEPLELDERRPPRFERPARRPREFDAQAERPSYAAPQPARDPFFDKPYEASDAAAAPAWEKAATVPVARGFSPNIKPKKRVAALFGAKSAE
jgi:hypothetical protein